MMHNDDGCTPVVNFACRRRLDREITRYLEEAAQRIILYKAVVDKEVEGQSIARRRFPPG